MTIDQKQDEIIAEFELLDDWMDKYEYLIQLGKELPPLDDKHKTDDNLIKGCQSQVWLHTVKEDKKIIFLGDGDAIITKGLVGLMIRIFSGHTPEEILNTDIYFVDKIGLKSHLSPTRSNGLLAMIKQIKIYALAYKNLAS